jgi:hypothetical protein
MTRCNAEKALRLGVVAAIRTRTSRKHGMRFSPHKINTIRPLNSVTSDKDAIAIAIVMKQFSETVLMAAEAVKLR